ncbi:MAG: zeta toxin family protein [Elusimicrobiota bacterium]|jgi:predicted ABC-type ATPase
MIKRPELHVIAGPNGAGKTTFAREFLPHFVKCPEFLNADLIAGGLSPFSASAAAIEAGRIMLRRIDEMAENRHTFAFETTLSGRGYLSLFRRLQAKGYRIRLYYLWVPSVQLAIQRVRDRVRQGGHSVPETDIRRRFDRGLRNLFAEYMPLLNTWALLDNSERHPRMIAYAERNNIQVLDGALFENIQKGLRRS